MARERWEEIVAYYKTYISILQPLLKDYLIFHLYMKNWRKRLKEKSIQ